MNFINKPFSCSVLLALIAIAPLSGISADLPPPTQNRHEANLAHVRREDALRLEKQGALPHILVRPGLIADRTGRVVRIAAETTTLKANDPVEFPLIAPGSGKDYEALAMSFASARDIYDALRFIGLEPGRGVDSSLLRFWPKGDRVRMVFHVPDSKAGDKPPVPFTFEKLILDTRTRSTLPEDGLIFAGSEWVPSGEPATGKVYAADAFTPGSIASVYNEGYTVLDVPRRAPQHDVYSFLVPNPDRILPASQLVEITLEPYHRDAPPHRFDLTLAVGPEGTNLIYTLLDSQGQAINSNRTQTGMLAALARYSGPGQDPYVTLAISNSTPIRAVQTVARLLDSLDNERGIRVDPPPTGHPYYKAFLPNEKFKKREDRFGKVAELTLTTTGGITTGQLVLVESEWKNDDAAPVFNETRIAVPVADALEAALKTGEEPPAVLLIFAPGGLTYGALHDFIAPALRRNLILYVFAEE